MRNTIIVAARSGVWPPGVALDFIRLCRIGATVVFLSTAVSLHAAVLIVTTLADSGAGSLRQQVASSAPGDTIQFSVSGTILLSSSITVPHTLHVQGPGAATLMVDADYVDRAFITGGNPVLLSGMEIRDGLVLGTPGVDGSFGQNGNPGGNAFGGAILDNSNSFSLVLSNIWFYNNAAQGGNGGRGGDNPIGAAFIAGNGGNGGVGVGGAVYSTGSVVVVNCTFSFNSALGGGGGGGGTNYNTAVDEPGGMGGMGGAADGGAVHATSPDTVSFTNCTITANLASGGAGAKGGDSSNGPGGPGGPGGPSQGGGISTYMASFCCDSIVTNQALGGIGGSGGFGAPPGPAGGSAPGTGGGIFGSVAACGSPIGNTLVMGNKSNGSYSNYFAGLSDNGFNFISSTDYVCSAFAATTQAGSPAAPIYVFILPLAQNGGGLPTFALDPDSSAPLVDQGYSFGLTTDERGAPRPYVWGVPEPPGGDGSDIGAFELGTAGLGMSRVSNGLVLSWPAYYGDFALQSATNLRGSNNWSDVPDIPVVAGHQLVVTNRMTNSMQFYRLIIH